MNNKGQTLVLFIFLIPALIGITAFVIDTGLIYYETNKLNNLNRIVIKYGLDNYDKEKIVNLININDSDIKILGFLLEDNNLSIKLEKKMNSTFGVIIGKKYYSIRSYYIGTKKDNKYDLKRGK